MKKYLLFLIVIFSCFIYVQSAQAGVYIFGTFGSGGEVDASSIGGEIGAIWPKDEPKYLLGIGMSWADSGKRESDAFNSPITNQYWDKVTTDEWEFHGTAGFGLIKNLLIVGTAGASYSCEGSILKDEDTSECESWEHNKTTWKFTGSGQLRYVYKSFIIGAGYHNRRGIVGGIGISF